MFQLSVLTALHSCGRSKLKNVLSQNMATLLHGDGGPGIFVEETALHPWQESRQEGVTWQDHLMPASYS
jgi:hypothetical protein